MIKPGFLITAGFSGFLFLALGAMTPFWPLWLADWGLSQAETGALLSFGIIIRVVMGVALPWAADRAGKPRRALALLAAITSLFFLAHEFAGNRFLLYLFTTITSAAIAGMTPIADALTLRAAAKGGFGFATARGVGSATFMLATILCGFAVAAFGPDAILWWLVLCFLPCIPLALHHPGGAGAPLPQPKFGEALALLKRPAFLLTMLASSTLLGGHAVLYTYGSLHWQSQGIADGMIGGLWAFGVACEVALMFLGGRWLIRRIGPAAALAISGMGGIIRWGFMTMDPGLIWLWPLQSLHALTFTAGFLGGIAMVQRTAPESLGSTAQGMVGAMAGGMVMALAGFLASLIYPLYGSGAFWIAAALSLTGLLASLALMRVKT